MCCLRELRVELQLLRELLALREVAFHALDGQREDGGVIVRNAIVLRCCAVERLVYDICVLCEDLSFCERQLVEVAVDAEEERCALVFQRLEQRIFDVKWNFLLY